MFIQRLIATLILVPLVLLILFYAPDWVLNILIIFILLAAGRECWKLIPLDDGMLRVGYLILLLFGLWLCALWFTGWLILGLVIWACNGIAILTYPQSQKYWGYAGVVAILGFILLPLFLQSLIHIYNLPYGKALLLYLFFLIWATDIGAYITGKQMGQHKLIPSVSPGKSWEGILGGYVLAIVVAALGYMYFKPSSSVFWFGLAVLTITISIFGDLFISILKRRCYLKDTGTLIPGHGGLLDRLDSIIAAAPLFYFGIYFG